MDLVMNIKHNSALAVITRNEKEQSVFFYALAKRNFKQALKYLDLITNKGNSTDEYEANNTALFVIYPWRFIFRFFIKYKIDYFIKTLAIMFFEDHACVYEKTNYQ